MTSHRATLSSSAVIVLIIASAAALVAQELPRDARDLRQIAGAFPQSEPGPLERRAKAITPENPIPRRTHLVRPPYPPEAAAVNARAAVTLRVTLNELGRVGEVRTVGVPVVGSVTPANPTEARAYEAALMALVRAAKDAVRNGCTNLRPTARLRSRWSSASAPTRTGKCSSMARPDAARSLPVFQRVVAAISSTCGTAAAVG